MRHSVDQMDKFNLYSTYGALFFGVPTKGMCIEDLAAMIGDGPQRYTLSLLEKDVGHRLQNKLHKEFCDAFDFRDSKIIQFFETKKTSSVEFVSFYMILTYAQTKFYRG